MIDVIVLAGGDIREKLHFINSRHISPALIPVSTRILASYIIDFYRKYEDVRISLVVEEDQREVVSNELIHYASYFNIVTVSNTNGVVDTLEKALEKLSIEKEVIINLVTTIPKVFPLLNEVQISDEKTDTNIWSSIVVKDNGVQFLGKNEKHKQMGNAFTGVFRIEMELLENALEHTYVNDDLLSVVKIMNKSADLKYKETEWIDCGHELRYYDAKAKLISSRSFNKIEVFPEKGILRKSSKNWHKLRAEEQYMVALPPEVKVYFPRVIQGCRNSKNGNCYEIEYYGYPNLSEYLLYWDLSRENWQRIFSRMKKVLKESSAFGFSIGRGAYAKFYFDKTINRVEAFCKYVKDSGKESLWLESEVSINGKQCLPFSKLVTFIEKKVGNLYNENDFCIMHGDFCFSNILYDVPTGIIRLVDPRGSFGRECIGIYGDRKYDIAKLAHSAIGYYDYFANGLFSLKSSGLNYEYGINQREVQGYVSELCRQLIAQMGYTNGDIMFIVGLLFISMAVLHDDSYRRQIAMYLHGIRILNENMDRKDKNESMY